jgi:hypothetical protein
VDGRDKPGHDGEERRHPVIDRQRLIGWILIVVAGAYLIYFLKVRVLEPGPLLERKEWIQMIASLIGLMLGTINVRMAAMRARGQKYPWIK